VALTDSEVYACSLAKPRYGFVAYMPHPVPWTPAPRKYAAIHDFIRNAAGSDAAL